MPVALRTASITFSVPFADVDAMQVVWHGNYLKYFDLARDRLFSDAGVDLYRMAGNEGVVFPVTRSQVKHIRPLRFRDEIRVTAFLIEADCRLVMDFEIRLAESGQLCTKGRTEQAAVRLPEGVLELHIPESIRRALGAVSNGDDAG